MEAEAGIAPAMGALQAPAFLSWRLGLVAGPGVAPGFPAYETGEALRLPTREVWRKRWVLPPQRPRARAARLATGCGQLTIRVSSMEEGGGVAPPRPREEPARFRGGWTCCVYQSLRGSLRLESHQRLLLMGEAACCWPTQGDILEPMAGVEPALRSYRDRGLPLSDTGVEGPPGVAPGLGGPRPPVQNGYTSAPGILVRPGGVAPPSGGYRPPVLRLNYERLERPAGLAPAWSTLARWCPAAWATAAWRSGAGADGVEPSSRASKARGLPVGRGPSGGRVRTCTSQPEGTGVTARLRSCLGSAPGMVDPAGIEPASPVCGTGGLPLTYEPEGAMDGHGLIVE